MGYVPANEIQVLAFEEFSGNKLIGTRHSLMLGGLEARYSWDSPYCPEGYRALGNALFVRILSSLTDPETIGCELHVSQTGVTTGYCTEKGNWYYPGDHNHVLFAVVFPEGCGAEDFNFSYFGVKAIGDRLAVIFLLPHRETLRVQWRTFRSPIPLESQIEFLNMRLDERQEPARWYDLRPDDGYNPAIAIETILLGL